MGQSVRSGQGGHDGGLLYGCDFVVSFYKQLEGKWKTYETDCLISDEDLKTAMSVILPIPA